MAFDIKTTGERVSILTNCADTLKRIAELCKECQRYHDQCTDYSNRADNVNARMASVRSQIQNVANELSDLASANNMTFQFEWVVGKGDLTTIHVSSSGNTVAIYDQANSPVSSIFYNAISATDVIRFQDAVYNSQSYIVVSTTPSVGAIYANAATPYRGDESLLSRVIKHLGGE